MVEPQATKSIRSGFISVIGPPNVGKSTLINRIVGRPVSITADKPHTTRQRILGIRTSDQAQMVFIDSPGIHLARDDFNKNMVNQALLAIAEADLTLLVESIDGLRLQSPIWEYIIQHLSGRCWLVLNKIDLARPNEIHTALEVINQKVACKETPNLNNLNNSADLDNLDTSDNLVRNGMIDAKPNHNSTAPEDSALSHAEQEQSSTTSATALGAKTEFEKIFTISASRGYGVKKLVKELEQKLDHGPLYFPPDVNSDQTLAQIIAEWVRQEIFRQTHEEVPYQTTVRVSSLTQSPELIRAEADIIVGTASQRGIIIGRGGKMLKSIGSKARQNLEYVLNTKVYLRNQVRVKKNWQAEYWPALTDEDII